MILEMLDQEEVNGHHSVTGEPLVFEKSIVIFTNALGQVLSLGTVKRKELSQKRHTKVQTIYG